MATAKSEMVVDDPTHAVDERVQMAEEAAGILSISRAMKREETAERLFTRLEAFESFAAKAPVDSNEMFIALGLPTANDLIYLTTTRRKLAAAKDWVRNRWTDDQRPAADESITLASLMLIYIVNEGWKHRQNDRAKREIWERIKRHVGATQ